MIIHAEERFKPKKKEEPILKEENSQKASKTSSFKGSFESKGTKEKGFVPFKFLGDLAKNTVHQWVVVNPDNLPDPFPPDFDEPGPMVA